MKNATLKTSLFRKFVFSTILLFTISISAQVGIGNTNPNPSSALDITSTTQGLLTPRMTTAQRQAIVTPANSLLVYDTDVKSFYYYDTTALPAPKWVKINSTSNQRDNYKLVKSVADLAPELASGGGSRYLLQTNTYYEINGTINLAFPIDLNNAYVSGLDANEDILKRASGAGIIFEGTTGGSIRNITITGGGTAFNITGGASLLVQNTVISGMGSVGIISNVGLYFSNIVQYVNNTNGITYNSIVNVLLSNQGWFAGNGGTYETFTGTFGLIQKVSGFSTVNSGVTAINVSSNPIVGEGVLLSTVFSGAGTFINRYSTGSYVGFNFNNNWVVNCPGIPRESDNEASANIYYNGGITTGFVQNANSDNTPFNLNGNSGTNTTTPVNMFRTTSPQNNRITYNGKKKRTFQVNASLSVRGSINTQFYGFFIRKNGTTGTNLIETNSLMRVNNVDDINSISISGTVELSPGDFIEVWGQRLTGSGGNPQLAIFSLNLNIR